MSSISIVSYFILLLASYLVMEYGKYFQHIDKFIIEQSEEML